MPELHPESAEIGATVLERLAAIERAESVRMLYARESGSRAWGFALPDSDRDVRFIYARPRDRYLSIDLERRRAVIERPIAGALDIGGWDLREALHLMRKSNPPLFGWLHSPVVYRAEPGFREVLLRLAPACSPAGAARHHLHMARGNHRKCLHGDPVWLKKCLYVLRPLLAVRWLGNRQPSRPVRSTRVQAGLDKLRRIIPYRGADVLENLMLLVVALAFLVGPTLLVPAEGGRARETCEVWDVW